MGRLFQKKRAASASTAAATGSTKGMRVGKRLTNPAAKKGVDREKFLKERKEELHIAKMRGEVIDPQDVQGTHTTWRIFRIMAEFVDGYDFLSTMKTDVTIFGSARVLPESPAYENAYKMGKALGEAGFSVITGGGPGIMEAANKGAFEVGAESIGLNIQLPFEQRVNPYVRHSIGFKYFFTRKVMLTAPSQAFIAFPGGFGTIDEVFEVMTLMQTGKMQEVPLIFFGKDFWEPLKTYITETMYEQYQTVGADDLEIFHIVDSVEEAMEIIHSKVTPDPDPQETKEVHQFM